MVDKAPEFNLQPPGFSPARKVDHETAFACVPRHLVEKIRDIKADIKEFDGDRRGMYAALEDAQRELIDAALDDIA